MTGWRMSPEERRASATVTLCEAQLRQARDNARRIGETLRRALRGVSDADGALGEATRRLGRMELCRAKALPGLT